MKHIKTIETRNLCESAKKGGCGECQTSCQSACKTSCGIANQQCESTKESKENKVQLVQMEFHLQFLLEPQLLYPMETQLQ